MSHKQGGHKTKGLVFPSNWTGKWLYRAIINTPKWQLNSVLNSYKFNQWIAFESMQLNGLQLSPRVSPETNFIRSVEVGIAVSEAGKQYESVPHKVPLEDKVRLLKEELEVPIIGDMVRSMTQAVLPGPMPVMYPNTAEVETPVEIKGKEIPIEFKEEGKEIPVMAVG
ncbi:hypothetical protein [Acidianus bottle-shaped virus]|uniref:Uncharacterized protein ORF167 n=1 Tax=Acidianus bottle-shaped virus (isolate Italy/Pozzuoli) TaxID=654911 RepID=Y167_ABVP|nr:hypothetical protein ABV_gp35 [Acidianus bottle-shaped virus]A4ZUC1.1 RecName: Full=Uncharacterized protein ORF167 [Acidianus bottle-shaped virus (isolate Pozzuoli)]ABP73425.1 hypothetical protein [Acidianus bottle-shaped virus]